MQWPSWRPDSTSLSPSCSCSHVAHPSSRYSEKVENYFDVYLRTPGLPPDDIARALLARGNARRIAGERLLARAQQGACMLHRCNANEVTASTLDFQAVAKIDPSNRELQTYLRRGHMVVLCPDRMLSFSRSSIGRYTS